jgi:hypothetical protein
VKGENLAKMNVGLLFVDSATVVRLKGTVSSERYLELVPCTEGDLNTFTYFLAIFKIILSQFVNNLGLANEQK